MTVLLADDDDGLRNNFARFIRQFFPVITAGTVDETRAALRARDDWRGFVFDLRFGPNQPEAGFTLLAEARALFPDVPAFIVTGFLDAETVLRAASLDARCWPKAMATEHFRQLANILEREKKPQSIASATPGTIPPPPGAAEHLARLVASLERKWKLSPAQRELFRAVTVEGLTPSEYRDASGKSASTVRTHTAELLNKAGEDKLEYLALRTLRHAILGRE